MATPDELSPFQCSICFNSKEGRQPRILSCVHSFCQECLQEWHEQRHREGYCARTQVECPTCRTISALPSGDISDLPMDIMVQQFADYINKESKSSCHVCTIKKVKSACMMCAVFLCEACGENHKKLPLFSSHELTRNICELHGAALQGVCTTCLCCVCLTCVNEGLHRDHILEDMSSAVEKIKSQVKNCTEELQQLLRQGNLENDEKRKFIKQCQRIEDMKRTLVLCKKEVERLEKEIAEHERLCDAKIDAVFKEYEAHRERASAAIVNGNELLEEDEAGVLNKLKSTDLPDEEMCSLLRGSLSSLPDFAYVGLSNCRLDKIGNALEVLKNSKLVCGIPDLTNLSCKGVNPVQVLQINCGKGCDIVEPWQLCGTQEGDVIVCGFSGGPVYKVYKDGRTTRLDDDGIAACENRGDVYVISTDGSRLSEIKQDDSTVNHKLKPPVSKPKGIAMYDDNVYILSSKAITKQNLLDVNRREAADISGYPSLSHLIEIHHQGKSRLAISDPKSHQVIICDEAGTVLSRFGTGEGQGGSLKNPRGISRTCNGNLLVVDYVKHNIGEYEMDGTFVRNLLTERHGIKDPVDTVYKYPYLWVAEKYRDNRRLKLFRFSD